MILALARGFLDLAVPCLRVACAVSRVFKLYSWFVSVLLVLSPIIVRFPLAQPGYLHLSFACFRGSDAVCGENEENVGI